MALININIRHIYNMVSMLRIDYGQSNGDLGFAIGQRGHNEGTLSIFILKDCQGQNIVEIRRMRR
jgi:hypothetical protein